MRKNAEQLVLKSRLREADPPIKIAELARAVGKGVDYLYNGLNCLRADKNRAVHTIAQPVKLAIEEFLKSRNVSIRGIWERERKVNLNRAHVHTALQEWVDTGQLSFRQVAGAAKCSPGLVNDLAKGRAGKFGPAKIAAVKRAVTALGFDGAKALWPYEDYVRGYRGNIFSAKEAKMLTEEVRRHFKLFRDPFTNEFLNGGKDVFLSRAHRRAEKLLLEAANNGGFLALVGHVGSGKTTIWKRVYEHLQKTGRFKICVPWQIDRAAMRASALVETLLTDLHVEDPPSSLNARARAAYEALENYAEAGKRVCLVIDEAHLLHTNTLKSLKRIYELGKGFKRLLAIILIGQMPLKARFDAANVEEVSRRCLVCEVQPLGSELRAYLEWKFERAGGKLNRVMTDDAAKLMGKQLAALRREYHRPFDFPLVVNAVVEMAMNLAVEAGEKIITPDVMSKVPMIPEAPNEEA